MSNVSGQFKVSVVLASTDFYLETTSSTPNKVEEACNDGAASPATGFQQELYWAAIGGDAASAWLTASREGGKEGREGRCVDTE